MLSIQDVEEAWADQVQACDWYERAMFHNAGNDWNTDLIDRAREDMLQATKHAERVQEMYRQQWERQEELIFEDNIEDEVERLR
jgi:hypothetical protein